MENNNQNNEAITKNKYYTRFDAQDNQGGYAIEIQNDCSQIRVLTGIDSEWIPEETFIDTDVEELTAIRDMINMVLSERSKSHE